MERGHSYKTCVYVYSYQRLHEAYVRALKQQIEEKLDAIDTVAVGQLPHGGKEGGRALAQLQAKYEQAKQKLDWQRKGLSRTKRELAQQSADEMLRQLGSAIDPRGKGRAKSLD